MKNSPVLEMVSVDAEWDTPSWSIVRNWAVSLPALPLKTLVRYRLAAQRMDTGQWVEADDGSVFSFWVDDDPPPPWASGALIYQIFPDRFYPGNGKAWNKTKLSHRFIRGNAARCDRQTGLHPEPGF